jgi:ATP-dependent 26S proteasome regulatory subunit
MQKFNPRNKVGVIVHAVSKIVLGDHTAKNIYGNVNYAKTLCGSIIFMDELDAIGRKRFSGNQSGYREVQRTMLELLAQ